MCVFPEFGFLLYVWGKNRNVKVKTGKVENVVFADTMKIYYPEPNPGRVTGLTILQNDGFKNFKIVFETFMKFF